jgi:outer membrane murein-binding lipoprotein Lpp
MALGLRDSRRRRRQQTQWLLVRWLLVLLALGAAGFYAYQTGRRTAEIETERLQAEISALTARLTQLETDVANAHGAAQAAKADVAEWQRRYERDVARGPAKELFEVVQARLAAGVEPDRLKSVLQVTQNRRDCRAEAPVKAFAVYVRELRKPRKTLTFGRGAVSMTIDGTISRDAQGNPEAWFDSAEPVTIRIIRAGGGSTEVSGVLPLFPSQLIGDREYRFSVVANRTRGLVDIAGESCRFP